MSKLNKSAAKIFSRKNIKSNLNIGFVGGTGSGSTNTVNVIESAQEILVIQAVADSNITLNNTTTSIDGRTLLDGDLILANEQTTTTEIDIYIVSTSGDWVRTVNDLNDINFVYVEYGTKYGATLWAKNPNTTRGDGNIKFSQLSYVVTANDFTNDNRLTRTDTVSGVKNIQESGITVSDGNDMSGVNNLEVTTANGNSSIDIIQSNGGGNFYCLDLSFESSGNRYIILAGSPDTTSYEFYYNDFSQTFNYGSGAGTSVFTPSNPGAGTTVYFTLPSVQGTAGQVLKDNGAGVTYWDDGGDINSTSTFTDDNRLIRTDTASGSKNIQQSAITVNDTGDMTGIVNLSATGDANIGNDLIVVGGATISGKTFPSESYEEVDTVTITTAQLLAITAAGIELVPQQGASSLVVPTQFFIQWKNLGTVSGTNVDLEIRDVLSVAQIDIHAAFDTSDWVSNPPDILAVKPIDQQTNEYNNSLRIYPVVALGYDYNLDGGSLIITTHYKVYNSK